MVDIAVPFCILIEGFLEVILTASRGAFTRCRAALISRVVRQNRDVNPRTSMIQSE